MRDYKEFNWENSVPRALIPWITKGGYYLHAESSQNWTITSKSGEQPKELETFLFRAIYHSSALIILD